MRALSGGASPLTPVASHSQSRTALQPVAPTQAPDLQLSQRWTSVQPSVRGTKSTIARSQRLHDASGTPSRAQVSSWWPWLVHNSVAPLSGSTNGSVSTNHPSAFLGSTASTSVATDVSRTSFTTPAPDNMFSGASMAPVSAAQCLQELLQRASTNEAEGMPLSADLPRTVVKFEVPEYVTSPGQRLVIVGSVPALGSWDFEAGARLSWNPGHRWTGEIELEPGWHGALEFKVALVDRNTHSWEPGSNRLLVVERPRVSRRRQQVVRPNTHSVNLASMDEADAPSTSAADNRRPVLHVLCDWGKAELPAPPLPASLQCAAGKLGILANGQPLNSANTSADGTASQVNTSLVMATFQVVVPWLEPSLSAQAMDSNGNLHLVLVGSVPALGCWDPAQGLRLAMDDAGMWRGRLELPMGYSVQAKLALFDSSNKTVCSWEPGGNRTFRLPEAPASLLHPKEPSTASQDVSSNGITSVSVNGASRSMEGVVSAMSRAGPWPVMPNGEFMLLTHWGTPGFPHLVFLPSLDYASQASSNSHGTGRQWPPSTVLCRFTVPHLPTLPNQHLLLVGGTSKLGNWDPTRGLRLQWGPGHSWQASVHLPAEDQTIEAKVVLWDGSAYRWEPGPNRRLRPADRIREVAPKSTWGEVLHILYWGSAQEGGRTPAVVIPQDDLLTAAAKSNSSGSNSKATAAEGPAKATAAWAAKTNLTQEPTMAFLQSLSTLMAMALNANEPSPQSAANQVAGTSLVVSSLEAAVESLRTQLNEAHKARQREVESVRTQLSEANKALAAEEDEVEALHGQLGSRTAEIRNLQQQLARAEATAAAAVAAATTALSSASSMYAAAGSKGPEGSSDEAAASLLQGSSAARTTGLDPAAAGNLPGVAAATFQRLTEQLAVLQLEADTARRALTEAHQARSAEIAHLRAELSEAVAWRHKEAEAARLAAAAAGLHHQQEVSALQSALAEAQGARQREMMALQARLEAVASAGAGETSRLVRQLAQACAAAEALESQLMTQRAATLNLSHTGGHEVRRLRGLLSTQAHELESLKGQLADGHAAAIGRLNWTPSAAGPAATAPPAADGISVSELEGVYGSDAALSAITELPPHLKEVMAEVRAAKAALESLTSQGPSGQLAVAAAAGPAVGTNGTGPSGTDTHEMGRRSNGTRAPASAGSTWVGSASGNNGRHVRSNIVPIVHVPSHNNGHGNGNGVPPVGPAEDRDVDSGERE